MGRLSLPFRLRGSDGVVHASVTVNDDPSRYGYDLLNLPFPVDTAYGFPVASATVEFPREGYAAELGWVQVVWMNDDIIVDRPPQLADVDYPYVVFGLRPAFFDAPSTTVTPVAWRARAFLTATPDCLMTRVIEPVTGFAWGYDRDGDRIDVRGPETVVDEDWRLVRDALARVLPRWELR